MAYQGLTVEAREAALAAYVRDAEPQRGGPARSFRLDGNVVDGIAFAKHLIDKFNLRLTVKTAYQQVNSYLQERFPLKVDRGHKFVSRDPVNEGHFPKGLVKA